MPAPTAVPEEAPAGAAGTHVVAVVLAGGGAEDGLARAAGVAGKALVPFGGRPLGAYVLDALRESRSVGPIVWVGHADEAIRAGVDAHVTAGRRLVDSLALGLGAAAVAGGSERILVSSADVPWLRGEGVDAFVAAAAGDRISYPVVGREAVEARFPGARRTWIRVREGRVTGGNVVVGDAEAWRALLPWLDAASRARKNPLVLAGMVGLRTALALLTGRARLADLEAQVSARLGLRVRAHRSDDAALVHDVDRPDQLGLHAPEPGDATPRGAVR